MKNSMISKIDQVAVVVEDAKATVKYLEEHFGIGPWFCLQFGDDGKTDIRYGTIEDCVTEGDPIGTYSIDCCCCDMANGVQIEVISPKTGSSIFARYLQRHGPGVQHISIVISEPYEAAIARMAEAGHTTGQFATVMTEETCAFVEHLKVLGSYLELHKRPENFSGPPEDAVDVTFVPGPGPEDRPAQQAVFRQLDQINVVVEDLEASLAVLEGQYGLGPWTRQESQQAITAVCDALNIRFQLTQPLDPESPDGRFLKEHGTDIRSFTARMDAPVHGDVPVQEEGPVLRVLDDGIFGAELELERQ